MLQSTGKRRIGLGWLGAMLFGCANKDELTLDAGPIVLPKTPTPHISVAEAAVYYGTADSSLAASLASYTTAAIIEPGNISASQARSIPRATAYMSLTSIHQNNDSLGALSSQIAAIDGWLRDASGHIVTDPTGPNAHMVDLRRPAVRQIMKNFAVKRAAEYPGGLFFDALDSATWLENQNRILFGEVDTPGYDRSLTDGAVLLIKQVSEAIAKMPGKRLIINGGSFERRYNVYDKDTNPQGKPDTAYSIAKYANVVATESRVYQAPGKPQTGADYTEARLSALAAGAQAAGKSSITIIGIEPAPSEDGSQRHISCLSAEQYEQWCRAISAKPGCAELRATLYACNGHMNAKDVTGNLALRQTWLCK